MGSCVFVRIVRHCPPKTCNTPRMPKQQNAMLTHSLPVCKYRKYLIKGPGELVPEIWVSFVFLKVLLLLLRLTINKDSQIKK